MHLYWQPGDLDFANPADRELFYSSALTTASSSEDFTQWINRDASSPRGTTYRCRRAYAALGKPCTRPYETRPPS